MTEQTDVQKPSQEGARAIASTLPPSVLINITTPGTRVSICRVGTKQELLGEGTIKQLLERCISLRSPLTMGVPIAQLESEMSAVLAIGELMASGNAEVLLLNPDGSQQRTVGMGEPVSSIARERTGEQGNVFYNIDLEVRTADEFGAPLVEQQQQEERRQVQQPNVIETKPAPPPPPEAATPPVPALTAESVTGKPAKPPAIPTVPLKEQPAKPTAPAAAPREEPAKSAKPAIPTVPLREEQTKPAAAPAPPALVPDVEKPPAKEEKKASEMVESPMVGARAPKDFSKKEEKPAPPAKDVVIIAQPQKKAASKTAQEMKEKGYVRKSDYLRAQFLPEVDSLDFSGLFVGDFGLEIRQERERKNIVLADPSRITEVLLQGNSYRRSGNHVKALTAYQELVDMDPSNADFRFLLGKTFSDLGRGEEAMEAFTRARELGHEGAKKEMEALRAQGHRPRKSLGFLRFWKQ